MISKKLRCSHTANTLDSLPGDIFGEVLECLGWKNMWKCRGVSKKWCKLFTETPYPNNVCAWELSDLPRDLKKAKSICSTITRFETDENEQDDEHWHRASGKMFSRYGIHKFDYQWILPMLTNLKVIFFGSSLLPDMEYSVRIDAGTLKKILLINREKVEDLTFSIWEHASPFDMESFVSGLTFPKVQSLTIYTDWFLYDLTSLRRFCETRISYCFPQLKTLEFVPLPSNERENIIQKNFGKWAEELRIPALPKLEVEINPESDTEDSHFNKIFQLD